MKAMLVIAAIGIAGLLLLAAVAAVVWYIRYALKSREAAATLASQLGWKPLTAGGPSDTWYGGVAQGRRVAIQLAAVRNPAATEGPRNSPYLRIVMDVVVREPLGAMALRSARDRSSLHRFEEAFRVTSPEKFGPIAREAMVEFVRRGYPTGMRGVTYRGYPGTRNLWVRDRAGTPADFLPGAVLPDAHTFVNHDHPEPTISQEEFGKILFEMAQIAYAIEQNR